MEQNPSQELIESLKEEIFQLKNIIRHIPGNLYWMDQQAVYQGCNNEVAHLFNLSHPDDIKDKNLKALYAMKAEKLNTFLWPVNIDETHNLNLSLIKKEQSYIGEEYVNTAPDEQHVFLSKKVILRNSKNEVSGLLGISFNITDRKNTEKALEEAKEKAEIANQAKTDFIQNMQHDLRTPLCGILGVINHLSLIEIDKNKKELLNDAEIAAQEVLNYFDHIVEFSQINNHFVPKIIREFDLKKLIEGLVLIESAAVRNKNINLIINYANDIPTIVKGDRFRIQRILLNMVNNAIKFTEKGYIRIDVSQVEKEPGIFKIIIEDTGIGIAKKNQEVIFDKFARLDPANKNIYKGTGLGLWIIKEFIKDLCGRIELVSEVNEGSCFTLFIPLLIN